MLAPLRNILKVSMVMCKPDAVTVTKIIQIHGTSNVMFVYALQKRETATSIPYQIDDLNDDLLNFIHNI